MTASITNFKIATLPCPTLYIINSPFYLLVRDIFSSSDIYIFLILFSVLHNHSCFLSFPFLLEFLPIHYTSFPAVFIILLLSSFPVLLYHPPSPSAIIILCCVGVPIILIAFLPFVTFKAKPTLNIQSYPTIIMLTSYHPWYLLYTIFY